MIAEERLKELLDIVDGPAVRVPPGWLAFARLVEQEMRAHEEQVGWANDAGELYRSRVGMPRDQQDSARSVYARRGDHALPLQPHATDPYASKLAKFSP